MKRSSDWPGRDVTWRPLSDGVVCWVGGQKEGLQALSAALPSRKAWKDEWTKPEAEGGMEAMVLESWSDPRPHEAVGAQCRGGERGQEGCGGACEQFPHGQEETSLHRWITPRRALDDALSRLSEFVARRSGHRLPEEEN